VDRRTEEKIVRAIMIGSLSLVLAFLVIVVGLIVLKGVPALSFSMVTQIPKGGYYLGKEGGVLNAILGSLYLGLGSTLVATLLALPTALALQKEYVRSARLGYFMRLSLDVLWGMPSIVYGAFGFIVMLMLGLKASLLGGIVVLTLLQLPIMVRSMEEVLRMVPGELKEASYTLGATRLETTARVVLRQAFPGLVTGVLLAFGRGIGDAASILFTAGYTDRLPNSLFEPVASLPLAIFFQLSTPFPEVQQRAYASALILLLLVLGVSLAARFLSKRFMKNVIR